ncbi:MAG: hypothetical protein ABW024_09280 [Microbacterium sp.]
MVPEPRGSDAGNGPVGPGLAVVFATVGYLALVIFGLGLVSLATGEAVIATPGLGQVPGIVATASALVVFALALWSVVRRSRPSFWNSGWVAAASVLAYLGGLWIAVLAGGSGIATATAVAGGIVVSWFGVVIAGTALVAAWSGIALVRTRARRPRWPWEQDEE